MEKVLGRYSDEVYALLRMVVGFLFACHGMQKYFGWFGPLPGEMPEALRWGAGAIELGGGLLVATGLWASWAAFVCSGMMAFAYFLAHHAVGAPLPIQNHGELATLYAWVFLYIATRGAGRWSVDALRAAA